MAKDIPPISKSPEQNPASVFVSSSLCCKNLLLAVFLIFIVFAVYANSLNNQFVYDDTAVIVENHFVRDPANLKDLFTNKYFARSGIGQMTNSGEGSWRPLATLTYFIDYQLWGMRPFGYHLTNVLWHGVCVVLWFSFLVKCLKNTGAALIGSLLAAAHPIMTEAVNAVAFREDILSTAFFLFSLLAGLLFLERHKTFWAFLSGACYMCALLSKEMAFFFPVTMFFVHSVFIEPDKPWRHLLRQRYYGGLLLVSLVYLVFRFGIFTNPNVVNLAYPGGSFFSNMLTMVYVFGRYVALLFWPLYLNVDYRVEAIVDLTHVGFWMSLLSLGFIVTLGLRGLFRRQGFGVGILWFFVNVIIVSNILPIKNIMAERYLYLPSFGFYLLAACAFTAMMKNSKLLLRRAITCVFIVVFFLCAYRTHLRNDDWDNAKNLWSQTVRVSPKSYNAHSNFAIALVGEKQFEAAVEEYQLALQIDPMDPEGHYNLARCYGLMEKTQKALEHYYESIRIDPTYAEAHNNIGIIFAKQGKYETAIREFKASLKINPRNANAYNNIGNCYSELKNYPEAIRAYQRAIEFDPRRLNAYVNLGVSYLETGDAKTAVSYLDHAQRIDPENPMVLQILAQAWQSIGDSEREQKVLEHLIKLKPDHREALMRLRKLRL
ncbi:tetratricopeptide repeat protein [PVC group bacterium]|nr:tetratricopeptide repeat protein [PVC group bacterium]